MKQSFAVYLAAIAVAFSAFSGSASAQTKEVDYNDLTDFDCLDISSTFDVTLHEGPACVKLTVDAPLAPYVEVYVKGRTLYMTYDTKYLPSDIKKMYKGKKASQPVFKADVYTKSLEKVNVSDNASLSVRDKFKAVSFELNVFDKATAKGLRIDASSASLVLKKTAYVEAEINTTSDFEINADGSSYLKLSQACRDMKIVNAGSSNINVSGDIQNLTLISGGSSQTNLNSRMKNVTVDSANSSKVRLSGSATSVTLNSANSSFVDANEMPVEIAEATMVNSSSFNVNVTKTLTVDLSNGSSLYFTGKPEFIVNRVVKSTLAPYAGTK